MTSSAFLLGTQTWDNVLSFLLPFEQTKILQLSSKLSQLLLNNAYEDFTIPRHDFHQDMKYWKTNFSDYCTFGFSNMNVKQKLTTLNLSNDCFNMLNDEQKAQLMYYLLYKQILAEKYLPMIDEILESSFESSNDYSLTFYEHMKYLHSLDCSENREQFKAQDGMQFMVTYLTSVKNEKSLLTQISLKDCGLNDDDLLLFCNAILMNKNIKNWSNLSEIDLGDNVLITDKHMSLLVNNVIVDRCQGISSLNLEFLSITNQTCNVLYDCLVKNAPLLYFKKINLRGNENISLEMEEKFANIGALFEKGTQIEITF